MTLQEVKDRLAEITAKAGDDEVAHGLEDDLRHDILDAIARGIAEAPREMAALALTSTKISFSRWCA